jgi:hypothetical protein
MQDTMSCVDNEPLEVFKTSNTTLPSMTVAPPKSTTKKRQQFNNNSSLKKRPKTKNNSKASTVAGVNAPAETKNVSRTIPRLPATLTAHSGWKIIGTASLDESIFTSKSVLLDNFLTTRNNDSCDTQEGNVKQLLSTLPRTNNSYNSPLDPIPACDRGYGKLSLIKFFMEQNFKIITVCAAVGSGHPMVTKSELNKVLERQQNQETKTPMMTSADN